MIRVCISLTGYIIRKTERTGHALSKHQRRQCRVSLSPPDVTRRGKQQEKMTRLLRTERTTEGRLASPRRAALPLLSPRTTRKPCCLSITAGCPGNRLLSGTTKKTKFTSCIHGNTTPHKGSGPVDSTCFRL